MWLFRNKNLVTEGISYIRPKALRFLPITHKVYEGHDHLVYTNPDNKGRKQGQVHRTLFYYSAKLYRNSPMHLNVTA